MSLIQCTECGKEVSSEAATCPACGVAVKKKTPAWQWLIAFVVAGVLGLMFIGSRTTDADLRAFRAYDTCMELVKANPALANPDKCVEIKATVAAGGQAKF